MIFVVNTLVYSIQSNLHLVKSVFFFSFPLYI